VQELGGQACGSIICRKKEERYRTPSLATGYHRGRDTCEGIYSKKEGPLDEEGGTCPEGSSWGFESPKKRGEDFLSFCRSA